MVCSKEKGNGDLDPKRIAEIVLRLEQVIVDYLALGRKMEIEISGEALLDVIDEVTNEAHERPPGKPFAETPEGFFLSGLYEELVQQPSNIFEQVTQADGKEYYVPLKPALWCACLGRLREEVCKMLDGESEEDEPCGCGHAHPHPHEKHEKEAPQLSQIHRLFRKR